MHLNIKCFIIITYLNAEIRKEKGLNKNNKVKQTNRKLTSTFNITNFKHQFLTVIKHSA